MSRSTQTTADGLGYLRGRSVLLFDHARQTDDEDSFLVFATQLQGGRRRANGVYPFPRSQTELAWTDETEEEGVKIHQPGESGPGRNPSLDRPASAVICRKGARPVSFPYRRNLLSWLTREDAIAKRTGLKRLTWFSETTTPRGGHRVR